MFRLHTVCGCRFLTENCLPLMQKSMISIWYIFPLVLVLGGIRIRAAFLACEGSRCRSFYRSTGDISWFNLPQNHHSLMSSKMLICYCAGNAVAASCPALFKEVAILCKDWRSNLIKWHQGWVSSIWHRTRCEFMAFFPCGVLKLIMITEKLF